MTDLSLINALARVEDAIRELADVSPLSAQAILDLLKTVDGEGSGLDADTLRGQSDFVPVNPEEIVLIAHGEVVGGEVTGSARIVFRDENHSSTEEQSAEIIHDIYDTVLPVDGYGVRIRPQSDQEPNQGTSFQLVVDGGIFSVDTDAGQHMGMSADGTFAGGLGLGGFRYFEIDIEENDPATVLSGVNRCVYMWADQYNAGVGTILSGGLNSHGDLDVSLSGGELIVEWKGAGPSNKLTMLIMFHNQ